MNDMAQTEKNIKENENISFEEALKKLEIIIKSLEDGSVPLDVSLEAFEEGINLVRRCNFLLDSAEKRVKKLVKNDNGEMEETDFI